MAMEARSSDPLSVGTNPELQDFAQGDHGSGLIVAIDSVRQIVGDKFMDYPLHGVPSPLTAALSCAIATVDCGSAQTLTGSCTRTRAKQACLPTAMACRAIK